MTPLPDSFSIEWRDGRYVPESRYQQQVERSEQLERELNEARRRSGEVCPQCGFVRGAFEE